MAASIVDILAEEARKEITGDTNYAKKGAYVFVLHGPPGEGPISPLESKAQFPLVLNPETFNYDCPFASELTALQEGGVVAEENGIVIGEITMTGTTGFKVRKPLGDTSFTSGDGEFSGVLDAGGIAANTSTNSLGVTGHMHFWRLFGRCFDGYSALKKNPQHAPKTWMEFHSLKDELHLKVVPRRFTLDRSNSRDRVTYRYNIALAVVGPASEQDITVPSPDEGLLQGMKNTINKVRNAVQSIQAAVDDVTAVIDEVRRSITNIAGILDDVGGILDAATDLVNGVKKFMDIPKVFINSASELVESAAGLAATVASFPADVAQSFREIGDGLDRLVTASRDHFREKFDEVGRKYERLTDGPQEGKDPARDARASTLSAAATSGKGRLSVTEGFGTGVRVGDVRRGRRDPIKSRSRLQPGRFRGFQERVVNDGDTLQSLAAKYMGDARDWGAIALANQLKAPYITTGPKLPGTLSRGDSIIIPIAETLANPDTLTTGAASLSDSQAESLLGVDFESVRIDKNTYGWAIDTAGGSVDVHKVRGVANLSQAIGARFRTEQGHNILYPQYGLPRLVGGRTAGDDFVNARYEARRQLLADARISRLVSLRFVARNDALELVSSVQPIGFTSARTISRQLT
jgi:hypothetical protein